MKKAGIAVAPVVVLSAVSSMATAQESGSYDDSARQDRVVVTGHVLSDGGLSQPVDILQGDELSKALAASIGETLSRRPGVASAQFGSAVGRPLVHGLGGPRVRVMEDRIDVMDVSVSSGDHAVTTEPFLAERIEVLKGANALLYGSGAIGGVVNVETGRIPQLMPERFSGGADVRYGYNGNNVASALKLSGPIGDSLAFSAGGSFRRSGDYAIPGFAESDALHAHEEEEEHEGEEEEEHEEERARDVLAGSHYRFGSGRFGASWIGDRGFVGISVSGIDSLYGAPGGHSHGHDEDEEEHHDEDEGTVTIKLRQIRTDIEAGINDLPSIFSDLNIRGAYNAYRHKEIEPSGETATTYNNSAWEIRQELGYEAKPSQGVLGIQHSGRIFDAVGAEAFIRPTSSFETGVFWAGQHSLSGFDIEAGARLGHVRHVPENAAARDFFTWAASAGVVAHSFDPVAVSANVDFSSRAPSVAELYANGPHLATGNYDIGDPNLHDERAANMSATLAYHGEMAELAVTGYSVYFWGFIYENATDEVMDDLPVMRYEQDKAVFAGVDAEICLHVLRWEQEDGVTLRAVLDHVHAVRVSGENLPRIPAMRYGFGVDAQWRGLSLSLDYLRVTEQSRTAGSELHTPGFDDLGLSVSYDHDFGDFGEMTLFMHARNLTDAEQRLHTSIVKDRAPQPGRNVEAGIRLNF